MNARKDVPVTAESVRRGEQIDALSDVILDAFPVSGSIGRAALALAFVKRAHADAMTLEHVQRAIADTWALVAAEGQDDR